MKRRVLITFTTDYYPSNTGFAQAFMHFHKSILQNDKCDYIYVFSEGVHPSNDLENIEVNPLPVFRGIRFLRFPIFERTLQLFAKRYYYAIFQKIEDISKDNTIQMILIESMFVAWLAPILRKEFPSIPIVCRIHGTGPEYTAFYREMSDNKFREYLLKCVFGLENIAATTKYYFDFFRDYYKSYGMFMDKEFFILPNTCHEEMKPLSKVDDKVTLLQLGRLDQRGYHQKGFQDTVKALMYIEKFYPDVSKKLRYVTIGTGDREQHFLNHASCLKLVEHTHFSRLDNRDVKKYEQMSDIVLVPSRCEGMSMFATEAICLSKPLICTNNNGLESVSIPEYNSLCMTEYDYVRYAEAIIKMVTNEKLRTEMSKNSKELFDKNYGYKAVALKYSLMVDYLNSDHNECEL